MLDRKEGEERSFQGCQGWAELAVSEAGTDITPSGLSKSFTWIHTEYLEIILQVVWGPGK